MVLGGKGSALGDHTQLGVMVDDGFANADIADADLAGHIAGNATENQRVNAKFRAKHLHGGGGVRLAHTGAANHHLLALQRAAVVLHPGVAFLGHVGQAGAQLVDLVGHSAHNSKLHRVLLIKR